MRETVRPKTAALFMLRCAELGLGPEMLRSITMGMVYDMLIEQANDREEYPFKATKDDYYRIFGG